jgi:transcription antitermination protein NusB
MSRKMARETAMKLLYQMDIGGASPEEIIRDYNENYEGEGTVLGTDEREYIENCVEGTFKELKNIDKLIERYSKEWKINRIAKVELSIMRLSIYEMANRDDIPNAVSVNEAIELAKKFGGENSSVFINGILGNIMKEYE